MSIIPFEKIEKLEKISMGLESIKTTNPIIEDMKWLNEQLRLAWIELERVTNVNNS